MAQFRRTDRLNEQLKQEIALLVRDEVRDPRVGLATITAVQASPELDHAKVYFTALGDAAERDEILKGLRSAAPFLRRELGKRVRMRRVPELHFELDRVLEEAERIERLLREALPHVQPSDEDTPDEPSAEGSNDLGDSDDPDLDASDSDDQDPRDADSVDASSDSADGRKGADA